MSSPLIRTYALPSGPRVRLRLARRSDRAAVTELLAGRGLEPGPLAIARLAGHDPTRRTVLCAFAPIDGAETLVGIAATDLAEGAEPDTVVVDERLTEGLGELLGAELAARAVARGRRAA